VNVARVWFQRAVFDHAAHRAVNCDTCHAGARTSTKSADILLPGKKTCLECHGPPRGTAREPRGGAGDSCTLCHRYHNGDHPLQGKGARARGAATPGTIEEFLRGRLQK
jgi:hypothetical protein